MKKRYITLALTAFVAVVAVIAALIIIDNRSYERPPKAEELRSVTVSSTLDGLYGGKAPVKTSDSEQIAVLLECIGKVRGNNRHIISDLEIAPIFYEVQFEFKDGSTETRQYTTYPSRKNQWPFTPFYKLFFPELYD